MKKFMIVMQPEHCFKDPEVYFTESGESAVMQLSDMKKIGTACQLFKWEGNRYSEVLTIGEFRNYEDD